MKVIFKTAVLSLLAFPAFAQTPTPASTPEPTAPVPAATPLATPPPTPEPTAPAPGEMPAATPEPAAPAPVETPAADAKVATTIGAYGELHYSNVNGRREGARVDFRRLVIRMGHRFDGRMSAASEIEIEHGGEGLGLEQVYLQYAWRRGLGVRGGLLLVPVGMLNEHHEPPAFHCVERNSVDTLLVPTTWREAGAALYGEPLDGLRYQVAVFNGLNAGGFSGGGGLRRGRSETTRSASNDGAVALRLVFAPIPGVDVGASLYTGGAGRQEIDESVAVRLAEADVRLERWGAELRAQVVHVWIDGAGALDDFLATGAEPVAPVGSEMHGWYIEGAYDVLAFARGEMPVLGGAALSPFFRYERTNTQVAMPVGHVADGAFDRRIATAGLTFKPIPKVALKADYQWTEAAEGDPENVWHLGMGFMF